MEARETFLFDKIVFGPVLSRRLGLSLGVNLLPTHSKLCNFNCIYCECGWNNNEKGNAAKKFNSRKDVRENLKNALIRFKESYEIILDAITFSGNGEPTMHPEFSGIIDDTIALRDKYTPLTKVAVLTNATMLNKKSVVEALKKVDLRILKLDAGTEELFQKIDQPQSGRSLNWIVDHLQYFGGDLIIQSIFLKGLHNGEIIDNSTDENVEAWLRIIEKIKPKQVMIYSIDRATPEKELEKIPKDKLFQIAERVHALGISTTVN